jgi:S-DNA-T family DNA segregation ATPase FtsK/SpoIIIE
MASTKRNGGKRGSSKRKGADAPKERPQQFYDRVALVLVLLGLVALVSLTVPNSGVAGAALRDGLKLLFGNGAFLLPLVLWLAAGALVFGYGRLALPEVLSGGLLVYLALLGWMAQPSVRGDWFEAGALREVIENAEFWNTPSLLTVALGKDVAGAPKYADLARMPHLLIGGATNSGKSMCLLSMIACLLFRATPRELRFVMIDPKRVELTSFDGIPHLMCPVVRDVRLAAGALRALLKEMDRRYDLFAETGVRNIQGYNERAHPDERLPYVVVIIDELADLMMQAASEVETSIARLAQLARATGIHLVIATQRPSVDVITGTIKANIASRIAFAVSSQVDSRTILDMVGAERLLGRGDMLFLPIDASKPTRIQGCFITEAEIEALADFWRAQESPTYLLNPTDFDAPISGDFDEDDEEDELYPAAVRLVVSHGQASTSMLQRRFKIGYGRAARLLDLMERRGIVGPLDGAKPRQVLVTRAEAEQMLRQYE